MAAAMSARLGWLGSADVRARARRCSNAHGLPTSAPGLERRHGCSSSCSIDKKVAGRPHATRAAAQARDARASAPIRSASALRDTLQEHFGTVMLDTSRDEARALAPYAAHDVAIARPASSGAAAAISQRIPARPRSHHSFHRVSPPGLQDAGIRQSRGRPVPHADHALARSRADRAQRRARAAAQRDAHRGDLPRARSRAHAVRPRGPGCARTNACASSAASSTTCSPCASSTSSRSATPSFPGLNLTFECREGILKHCSQANARQLGELGERFLRREQPGLEAQLANLADEIAYNNHDVDDGVRAGLITVEQLLRDAALRRAAPAGDRALPAISAAAGSCTKSCGA